MPGLSVAIRQMIAISDREWKVFVKQCSNRKFANKEFLCTQNDISDEVFFIEKGITRSLLIDQQGTEHTIHFSMENQFICDYASFLTKQPSSNSIQALAETEAVVIPRKAIEWGYQNLKEGDRLGRLIAEYYFIYFDARLKNLYFHTPAERYEKIGQIFPHIHRRVPQHMIASYSWHHARSLEPTQKEKQKI